jgi:hypothetical protein
MQYTTTSIEGIIARIIRNTRITDMSYADDIYEWIGEGVDNLRIKSRLPRDHHIVKIKNHKEKLPCGLVSIDGVVFNGKRLRYGFSIIDPKAQDRIWKKTQSDSSSYFVTDTASNQQDYNKIKGLDLKQVNDWNTDHYYFIEMGYIKTSFKETTDADQLVIFYKKTAVDDKGYPLIPDLEDAKEALFWYVTGKLVFSGFKLADPRHDYSFCDNKATIHFRKAKNEIKRLGIDEKESMLQSWVSLIPPTHFYDNFFTGMEQPQQLYR